MIKLLATTPTDTQGRANHKLISQPFHWGWKIEVNTFQIHFSHRMMLQILGEKPREGKTYYLCHSLCWCLAMFQNIADNLNLLCSPSVTKLQLTVSELVTCAVPYWPVPLKCAQALTGSDLGQKSSHQPLSNPHPPQSLFQSDQLQIQCYIHLLQITHLGQNSVLQ